MSRKNIIVYEVAAAQSLAASFHTNPTVINYLDNCSYQIDVTTTNSIGVFSVQASLDYKVEAVAGGPPVVVNAGHWIDLTLSGLPVSNGVNDDIIIDLNQLPFSAIRLAYTPSVAGTGHADVFLMAKQVGG